MSRHEVCPRCGVALDSRSPEGLCPACLLRFALDETPRESASTVFPAASGPPTATMVRDGGPDDPIAGMGTLRYFGDYELIELIARGGMGVVFRARQVTLDRIVAVKMILAGELASDEDVQRFLIEAQAAANLDHPGIVPIYEVGRHLGRHYFSMAFVPGVSLAQRIAVGPLAPGEAADLIERVSTAVQYAHGKKILHRDLKPANILLDRHGTPRITDFGLAKRLVEADDLTRTGQVMGTPSYMSPEQSRGDEKLGPTADVYSLGAILYAAVTGRPPFQAAKTLETIAQVLERDPLPPRELNPSIPGDLETIVLKALEKDPLRRYSTAAGLGDDLRRFLDGEPIHARRATLFYRGARWVRRRKAVAGLVAAAVIASLFAVALAVAAWYNRSLQRSLENEGVLRAEADRRGADSARFWYAADVNLAQRAWEGGDVARAIMVLDRQQARPETADRRGFEWYYMWRVCHQARASARPFTDRLWGLGYSGDGKRVVVAQHSLEWMDDPKLPGSVVQLESADLRTVASQSRDLSQWAAFAAGGGAWAAFSGADIHVFDPVEERMRSFHLPDDQGPILAVSNDARRLVVARQFLPSAGLVFDAEAGRIVHRFPEDMEVDVAAFSPDGKLAAIVGHRARVGKQLRYKAVFDSPIRLWDVARSKVVGEFPTRLGPSIAMVFTPDGRNLIAGGRDRSASGTGRIEIWNVAAKRLDVEIADTSDTVVSLAVSPDGKRLASGSAGKVVRIWNLDPPGSYWDADSGELLATFRGHAEAPEAMAFAPDGRTLVSGDASGLVMQWSTVDDPECQRLGSQSYRIGTLIASPDARTLYSVDYTEIWTYEAATGKLLSRRPTGHWVFAAALSPDGRTIALGGENEESGGTRGQVTLVDLGGEGKVVELSPGDDTTLVDSVAFSPDGRLLAVAVDGAQGRFADQEAAGGRRWSDSVQVWDVATRSLAYELKDVEGPVAFSPDGGTLAMRKAGGGVSLWDMGVRKVAFELGDARAPIVFSPDGRRLVTASADGVDSLVWDVEQGRVSHKIRGAASPRAVSPDGRTVVDAWGGRLRLYQLATGQELLTLSGHDVPVAAVAFSPDGAALYSGGGDRDENDGVRIWRAPRVEPGASTTTVKPPSNPAKP